MVSGATGGEFVSVLVATQIIRQRVLFCYNGWSHTDNNRCYILTACKTCVLLFEEFRQIDEQVGNKGRTLLSTDGTHYSTNECVVWHITTIADTLLRGCIGHELLNTE